MLLVFFSVPLSEAGMQYTNYDILKLGMVFECQVFKVLNIIINNKVENLLIKFSTAHK